MIRVECACGGILTARDDLADKRDVHVAHMRSIQHRRWQGMGEAVNDWKTTIERTTGEPAVPVVVRRMHRVFWVPGRYVTVAAFAFDGQRFTIRQLAERASYSVKGAWSALRAMEQMGFGVLTTTLGCHGRTRFKLQSDVSVSNVSTTDTSKKKENVSPSLYCVPGVETFGSSSDGWA